MMRKLIVLAVLFLLYALPASAAAPCWMPRDGISGKNPPLAAAGRGNKQKSRKVKIKIAENVKKALAFRGFLCYPIMA